MIHNFWSHRYLTKRIREKAEEYGIKVKLVDERDTSSICPRCSSKDVMKRKRLFKCLNCGLEAHRDAAGCVNINISLAQAMPAGGVNRAVARPLLLCIGKQESPDFSRGSVNCTLYSRVYPLPRVF